MRVIKPKSIKLNEVKASIDFGLQVSIEDSKALFALSFHNWDNTPIFEQKGPRTKGGNREVEYSTVSTPYIWVDDGTKGPYTIRAKTPAGLTFKPGGIPMTKPGRITSMSGSFGSQWIRVPEVTHPGIEPRDFSGEVVERIDAVIDTRVQKAQDGVDSL